MNVGHDGHVTFTGAQLGDDVLQIRGVLHRGRGDADNLAADCDQIERLLHARLGVHRVAGDHGLHHDRMAAADDDAAARGIAHHDFTRPASLMEEGGFAIAHEDYLFVHLSFGSKFGSHILFYFSTGRNQILDIKKCNVEHIENQDDRTSGLKVIQQPGTDGLPTNKFD